MYQVFVKGGYCIESCPLFILLRYRTLSSPICLSEAVRKPFALSRVFLLSSGGKSIVLVKKKRLLVVVFLCLRT